MSTGSTRQSKSRSHQKRVRKREVCVANSIGIEVIASCGGRAQNTDLDRVSDGLLHLVMSTTITSAAYAMSRDEGQQRVAVAASQQPPLDSAAGARLLHTRLFAFANLLDH